MHKLDHSYLAQWQTEQEPSDWGDLIQNVSGEELLSGTLQFWQDAGFAEEEGSDAWFSDSQDPRNDFPIRLVFAPANPERLPALLFFKTADEIEVLRLQDYQDGEVYGSVDVLATNEDELMDCIFAIEFALGLPNFQLNLVWTPGETRSTGLLKSPFV